MGRERGIVMEQNTSTQTSLISYVCLFYDAEQQRYNIHCTGDTTQIQKKS